MPTTKRWPLTAPRVEPTPEQESERADVEANRPPLRLGAFVEEVARAVLRGGEVTIRLRG